MLKRSLKKPKTKTYNFRQLDEKGRFWNWRNSKYRGFRKQINNYKNEQMKHTNKKKSIKRTFRACKELQKDECSEFTINEILIEHFYKTEIHQTFETLHNWSKKGFSVKKEKPLF